MSDSNYYPPLRPPPAPHSPSGRRSQSSLSESSQRSESSLSTRSNDSASMGPPPHMKNRGPFIQQTVPSRPSTAGGAGPTQSSPNLSSHRSAMRTSVDGTLRASSPGQQFGHRARQHSQGFFEPSLPHAAANPAGLSASQIAAQAAMHHMSPPPGAQERKRSYPGLAINTSAANSATGSRKGSTELQSPFSSAGGLPYSNGTLGGSRLAATTAANVVFPISRSPLPSPGPTPTQQQPFPMPDKEPKSKSSKMKLFSSRPKNLNLSKDKDSKAVPAMSSPGKSSLASTLLRPGFANASTTSLVDPLGSSATSIYSSANASTSTLVPTTNEKEKEKEKRHHFLSRQKNKLKDEALTLPLSSAHSNSQPTNPDRPQPLYSFTPDSPGVSTFAKSMSGLDLRHGGRALREKKKEEKAAAAAAKYELTPMISNTSNPGQSDTYVGPSPYDTSTGPPSTTANTLFSYPSETSQAFNNIGEKMGLPGIGPDDAWPLLKARLLNLFSGEDLRTPIEDFNTLVNVHIRRCIQRKSPIVLVEDVRELLRTGFTSLSQTLRGVPDDKLVLKLVEMWIGVYASILPFLQAVFLPLDLEFKGRGQMLSVREAQDFWGAMPESLKSDERPTSAGGTSRLPTLGEELDVRRITLISFRDVVVLPKHESLMAIFSRLSLESINASASPSFEKPSLITRREHARSDPANPGAERPGTAGSLSPHLSSFNSQSSTLLDAASTSSGGAAGRSRATSNTSAGSFGTNMPHLNSPSLGPHNYNAHHPPLPPVPPQIQQQLQQQQQQQHIMADPAKVTETVARMLQCLYVLASCQTGDVGQGVVERLTGALKYNWLGRGRTGRDRRGWVGMKNPGNSGASGGQRVGIVGA